MAPLAVQQEDIRRYMTLVAGRRVLAAGQVGELDQIGMGRQSVSGDACYIVPGGVFLSARVDIGFHPQTPRPALDSGFTFKK
jgi:hypothetical protein